MAGPSQGTARRPTGRAPGGRSRREVKINLREIPNDFGLRSIRTPLPRVVGTGCARGHHRPHHTPHQPGVGRPNGGGQALAGNDAPEVTTALLARLTDPDKYIRKVAAGALEAGDEAVVLLQLVRPGAWLVRPSQLRERFGIISAIADRAYLRIPQSDRARVRRRLDYLTRWV